MAYYLKWDDSGLNPGAGWFMIDESVGRGMRGANGVNRKDDVMLVQWAISPILADFIYLGQPLTMDGVYDWVTDYHVCRFMSTRALATAKQLDPFARIAHDTILQPVPWGRPDAGLFGFETTFFTALAKSTCFVPKGEAERRLASMPPFLQDRLRKNVWNGKGTKPRFAL
jgi:hypothetical protein